MNFQVRETKLRTLGKVMPKPALHSGTELQICEFYMDTHFTGGRVYNFLIRWKILDYGEESVIREQRIKA